ncbi:MAG: MBL fold metallo-hydrolase [Vicinamibacterales bacterium]
MTRSALVAGLLVLGIGSAIVSGRQAAQPNVAQIEKVKDNLYVIKGGGGNTAAFVTAKGVVLVDTKNPGWGPAILDKVKSVTDKPVTMILNTHTHGDHVGSNMAFGANVEVVAHENTKTNMMKMDAYKDPANQPFLPKRTFKDKLSVLEGRERIDLYYFGAGHTNGDAIIVFPALRVAHTGDLFSAKGAPLIDANNGGSGVAYPKTVGEAAASIKDADTVIPGHADVTDWKTFQEFGSFTKDFLAAVEAAAKAGKSVDEAAAGLTLATKYPGWNLDRAKDNVAKIYAELKK